MKWDDSLYTGNTKIDNQHKELIQRIEQVIVACQENKGAEIVNGTLDFLGSYVVEHFSDEEKLQKQYNYPDYENHKKLHKKFVADFTELRSQFNNDGSTLTVITKLNRVLVQWLMKHIKIEDKKIATYIKTQV